MSYPELGGPHFEVRLAVHGYSLSVELYCKGFHCNREQGGFYLERLIIIEKTRASSPSVTSCTCQVGQ